MELLVVLAILAVLLGIGVGAFNKIALGRRLAVSQVKDQLRAARLFAIEQSAPARVDVYADANLAVASGYVATGNWHFEDARGWPTDADLPAEVEVAPHGAIGRALAFAAGGGIVALGTSPSFDAEQGLRVEAFVRLPEEEGCDGATIAAKGEAFRMWIAQDGRLAASVRARVASQGRTGRVETAVLEADRPLSRGRWVQVALSFDGRGMALEADGVAAAESAFQERMVPVPDADAALVVGSVDPPFTGRIDELKLASIVSQDPPPLPDGVRFAGSGAVVFDGAGRLDPAHHARPAVIVLEFEDEPDARTITVGLLGDVR